VGEVMFKVKYSTYWKIITIKISSEQKNLKTSTYLVRQQNVNMFQAVNHKNPIPRYGTHPLFTFYLKNPTTLQSCSVPFPGPYTYWASCALFKSAALHEI
jgi:hypothetical protein